MLRVSLHQSNNQSIVMSVSVTLPTRISLKPHDQTSIKKLER